MNSKKVVKISSDGLSVRGLHTDVLVGLGSQSVTRASHVEFDDGHEKWLIRMAVGEEAGKTLKQRFDRRDEAIKAEIEFLNESLKRGRL
jgi:hypothetical protein